MGREDDLAASLRGTGLDFFRQQGVTTNCKQKNYVFTARDHFDIKGGLLESSFSFKRFNANVWGQGTNEQTLTPTVERGNYFATQDRHSRRLAVGVCGS